MKHKTYIFLSSNPMFSRRGFIFNKPQLHSLLFSDFRLIILGLLPKINPSFNIGKLAPTRAI